MIRDRAFGPTGQPRAAVPTCSRYAFTLGLAACIESVHWRTLQQRLIPVSSARITSLCFVLLLLVEMATAIPPRQTSSAPAGNGRSARFATARPPKRRPPIRRNFFSADRMPLLTASWTKRSAISVRVLQVDPQSGRSVCESGRGLHAAQTMDQGSRNAAATRST